MKVLVIPDIHGRYELLKMALSNYPEHHYVFLGDIIDRGDDSKNCIRTALRLKEEGRADLILGNHEYMAWMAYTYPDRYDWWLGHGGKECLESYGSETDFKLDLFRYLEVSEAYITKDTFLFSHAGIPAIFGNTILGEDHLWLRPQDGVFHKAPENITHSFHGHTPFPSPKLIRPDGITFRYYLDLGMKSLAVMDLDDMSINTYSLTS